MPDDAQSDEGSSASAQTLTPGAFVFEIPFLQKVTLLGVIGTLLSVVSAAIGMAWQISSWKTSLETHLTELDSKLKDHDERFKDLQHQMEKLQDSSGDVAKELSGIQATLSAMGTERSHQSSAAGVLDKSADKLADKIAEIGNNLKGIAGTMHDGIPIALTQVQQKSSELQPPGAKNEPGATGSQKLIQNDQPLKEVADELIKIEGKLLDPSYKIPRRSREALLIKVLSELEQVEALRAQQPPKAP